MYYVDDRLPIKIIGFFFIETQSEIFQHMLIQQYFKTFKVINTNDLWYPLIFKEQTLIQDYVKIFNIINISINNFKFGKWVQILFWFLIVF